MEKSKLNKVVSPEDPMKKKKLKMTQDEYLAQIPIKSIEKDCLDRVFKMLSGLQDEASSDEESAQKKYKKGIEARANEKKMKVTVSNFVSKTSQVSLKHEKKYKEDEKSQVQQQKKEEDHQEKKGRVGVKAIRKVLRTLCDAFPKDEMDMMIWEVDENLDGYVSEVEFEKMYKRCVTDALEQEPKKLYYLVQFLMYDKEKKGYITVEDTLEILYIRNEKNFDEAIDAIFE